MKNYLIILALIASNVFHEARAAYNVTYYSVKLQSLAYYMFYYAKYIRTYADYIHDHYWLVWSKLQGNIKRGWGYGLYGDEELDKLMSMMQNDEGFRRAVEELEE